MSPETDQPRQRTVAELLAENGGQGATGRRRRRRAADGPDAADQPAERGAEDAGRQAQRTPDRFVPPAPAPPAPAPPLVSGSPGNPPDRRAATSPVLTEPPTEQLPRIRVRRPRLVPRPVEDATGPIDSYLAAAATDGGPPTVLGAPPLTDDDADQDAADRSATVLGTPPADNEDEEGSPRSAPADDGDHPAEPADEEPADEEPTRRRLGRGQAARVESDAPGWAAVIGQWVGGAIAGAALWVGFRYLWFNLPVVAVAAAVVVTVALVLGVRALLRNNDLRTTAFAVLVGLLLTASPAILVLLGR